LWLWPTDITALVPLLAHCNLHFPPSFVDTAEEQKKNHTKRGSRKKLTICDFGTQYFTALSSYFLANKSF